MTGDTTLVSRASGERGVKANGVALYASISADGRFVSFVSKATNLSPDDGDQAMDVYVREVRSGETILASRADGPTGVKGNGSALPDLPNVARGPSISADGNFVVFESDATNLTPDDANGTADVFMRDLRAATTTLVSRASGPTGAEGNQYSYAGSASDEGRFVVFASEASNLTPDDGNQAKDVFVRDLREQTTALVSRADGADGIQGNDDSYEPSISANGRFVAFLSYATNLTHDRHASSFNVFVRDLRTGKTTLVSQANGHPSADPEGFSGGSGEPSVSATGRFISFNSFADNLTPNDRNGSTDVFLRDLRRRTTTLVSRASGVDGKQANADSGLSSPSHVSADGRFVAFDSAATNLAHDNRREFLDVFIRDLRVGTTTLVSRSSRTAGAKGGQYPTLSADGRFVAFTCFTPRLTPDDPDASGDVFVRQLGSLR